MHNDTYFAKLVSLGCHDVRTPLATVHGFAKTLTRTVDLEAPADRYVEMIEVASAQTFGGSGYDPVPPRKP